MPAADLPVAHLDLDAFFAAVEERQKPSLRGTPVVVAGLGPRGVITTANYPARAYGVRSAMPTWQGRALAPLAAWLSPRFEAYAEHSRAALAPVLAAFARVEQVAFDEVYVDLTSAYEGDWTGDPRAAVERLRGMVSAAVGLSASVGVARHKLGAKLASEAAKPGGTRVLDAAAEEELLLGLPVTALPGIGPVGAQRLSGGGIRTLPELRAAGLPTVTGLLGSAVGRAMWELAHGRDERPVEAERVRKSVGSERTFAVDLHGLVACREGLDPLFAEAHERLLASGETARTVTVKLRYADFAVQTRSVSLPSPSDDEQVLLEAARRALLASSAGAPGALGVRLLGVAFSGLDSVAQLVLGAEERPRPALTPLAVVEEEGEEAPAPEGAAVTEHSPAGADVVHPEHGRGWLVGAGHGVASVRFETTLSPPARTRSVRLDGTLRHAPPEPVVPGPLP
ncbi:DNA polymerase-4 [Motilibacter rhizosphaerae]|uniref:DNA polymerase IV n=1 Tax=Motilibacter rhizosphaerae TaxID=598652 RepID=A0A4Q7NS87_9ACTN|nr:DNA polymerase IV [Motilibacter rhizosphaerae]RZS89804.1 DNA polymerase-4 [Motilibacter rhizosphaerae]